MSSTCRLSGSCGTGKSLQPENVSQIMRHFPAAPLSEIEVMKTALTWEDLGQRWSAAIEKSKDGPRRQFVLPQCSTSTGATATIVLFRLRP